VEDRIHELAGNFAAAIWCSAVISIHLHVVAQVLPEVVSRWSNLSWYMRCLVEQTASTGSSDVLPLRPCLRPLRKNRSCNHVVSPAAPTNSN
jgi:hypothetical protein